MLGIAGLGLIAYRSLPVSDLPNVDFPTLNVGAQTAIAAVMPLLPAGMPAPPSFRKFNPADQPIMFLGLTSDVVPMYTLDDYAETMIAPRISMVSGVSQAQVQGAQKYAVSACRVDPNKLHAQSIGINEVTQAIQSWNVNLPRGQLFGADASRRGADRARTRRRRSAASARPRRRRRTPCLAVHHAVSHAGRVHLHGAVDQNARDSCDAGAAARECLALSP